MWSLHAFHICIIVKLFQTNITSKFSSHLSHVRLRFAVDFEMQHLPRAPIARSTRRRQQEAALPPPTVFETSSLPSNAELPHSPSNSGRDSSLSFDFASTRTPSSSLDSSVGAAFQESALSRELCTMQKSLSQLSENLRSVEARQIELGTSMDELKQLIQNLTQTSFCIKGSIYEVHEHETLSIVPDCIYHSCWHKLNKSHKTVNMTYMDFDIWCSCAATIEIANCKTVL